MTSDDPFQGNSTVTCSIRFLKEGYVRICVCNPDLGWGVVVNLLKCVAIWKTAHLASAAMLKKIQEDK